MSFYCLISICMSDTDTMKIVFMFAFFVIINVSCATLIIANHSRSDIFHQRRRWIVNRLESLFSAPPVPGRRWNWEWKWHYSGNSPRIGSYIPLRQKLLAKDQQNWNSGNGSPVYLEPSLADGQLGVLHIFPEQLTSPAGEGNPESLSSQGLDNVSPGQIGSQTELDSGLPEQKHLPQPADWPVESNFNSTGQEQTPANGQLELKPNSTGQEKLPADESKFNSTAEEVPETSDDEQPEWDSVSTEQQKLPASYKENKGRGIYSPVEMDLEIETGSNTSSLDQHKPPVNDGQPDQSLDIGSPNQQNLPPVEGKPGLSNSTLRPREPALNGRHPGLLHDPAWGAPIRSIHLPGQQETQGRSQTSYRLDDEDVSDDDNDDSMPSFSILNLIRHLSKKLVDISIS